jgi:hypothetical protein
LPRPGFVNVRVLLMHSLTAKSGKTLLINYDTQESETLYIPSGDVLVHSESVAPGITFPRI